MPVTVIDTMGFNDPNAAGASKREANQAIIMELMKKITKIPYINLFLICVNGTTLRRLNYSLIYMLQTFEEIFGLKIKAGAVIKNKDTFWHKCVIIKLPRRVALAQEGEVLSGSTPLAPLLW